MATTFSCFVAKNYQVFLEKGAEDNERLEYQFNLETRGREWTADRNSKPSMIPWIPNLWYDREADRFFHLVAGSPEKLMCFVRDGHLSKTSLGVLLIPEARQRFFALCAVIEKDVTTDCGASGDPCLEDGCAFKETDEVCLNAILLSEGKCLKSCIDLWIGMFQNHENRIEVWKK